MASRQPLTLRLLVQAVGVDPAELTAWSLYGTGYEGGQWLDAVWDHSLPEPGTATDQTIGLFLNSPTRIATAPVIGGVAGNSLSAVCMDAFLRMDADWYACLQLEIQVAAMAQQLKLTLARLGSLSRDLGFDEARFADQRDKHDWQDARRWLRDVADRAGRFLKDQQTGSASTAGKKASLEYLYENYVARRLPFEGIEQTEREFESHRKALQTLLNNLTTANNAAVQDGERRAQQILSRIAAKVRGSRSKR